MVNGTAAGIDIHEQITIIAVHNAIMVISLVSILLPAPCSLIPVSLTDILSFTFFQKTDFQNQRPADQLHNDQRGVHG
jgi:hypothetical protein